MNIKELGTQQIMAYAEMVTKTLEELNQIGGEITLCCSYGGIEESDKEDMHKEIALKMNKLEEARIDLAKEINRRLKKHLGIPFGPSDVQPLINKFVKKHPLLGKKEAEIQAVKAKEEKAKLAKV